MRHIVGVSGGKDSTAMALILKEEYPLPDGECYEYVITPTGDEFEDMVAHWKNLEVLLGTPLTVLSSGHTLNSLIESHKMLPNHRVRFCTRTLKIEPFIAFMSKAAPAIAYIGLRADEPDEVRRGAVYGDVEGISQRFILREKGMTEADVWAYLDARGITIPERTDCKRCFFQRLIEWRRFKERDPLGYAEACLQEQKTGHTFRSPQRDQWPADLLSLAAEFDSGRKIRGEDKEDPRKCRVCRL